MRAVVRRGPGRLEVDTLADLVPAEGQVLVKSLCCGICGSDLHAVHHMESMIELGRRTGEPGTRDGCRSPSSTAAPISDGGTVSTPLLTASQTDMIYALITNELGLLGAAAILLAAVTVAVMGLVERLRLGSVGSFG